MGNITFLKFVISNKVAIKICFYMNQMILLACIYLNNAWDLVLLALPLYVCLFKINRFMYFPIVSRFG